MITIDPPSSSDPQAVTISKPALTRFLRRARVAVGLEAPVDVLLTSDQALRSLNRNFRGKNKPTDVLSFPAPPELAPRWAGDLAISLDTAARQAQEHQHSTSTEVRILLLHGLLHLAGMDHETDRGEMADAELRLRQELRLPNSLIARSTALPRAQRRRTANPASRVAAARRRPRRPQPATTGAR